VRAETTIGGGAGAQHTEKLCLTPRSNAALPQRLGDFSTLWEALDYAALGETGFNFYSSRGVLTNVLPYRRLRERAVLTAQRLLSLRLEQGARVAVIADTDQDFLNVFFGCQYAGLIPCPLPYNIYLGGKDAYVAKIAAMMACAGAALAISPPELAPYLASAAARAQGYRASTIRGG
jgi:fatty-acyl-CoA synthase